MTNFNFAKLLAVAAIFADAAPTASARSAEPGALLQSRSEPELDYPIRMVEADPYWRPAEENGLTTQQGLFLPVHKPLRAIRAERLRLPTPNATWKLTGRVGRLQDGTIVAGFGA